MTEPISPGAPTPFEYAGASASVAMILPFLRLLEERGPAVLEAALDQGDRALTRWGVTRAELEADPRKRLPYELMIELLLNFLAVLDDPSAPLRAGIKHLAGDLELIEHLAASCATLADAIRCVGHYYALLGPAELELHVEADRAQTRFRISRGLDAPDALNEFAVASNFAMSILHIQLEGVQPPLEVQFAHAAPAHAAVFPEIFMAPVVFGCEHNGIVFPRRMLEQPMANPNPGLHAVLTRLADVELEELTDHSALPARVRAAIDLELQAGARLEAVAARMHMSPSTLRSRLQQYGTNYSAARSLAARTGKAGAPAIPAKHGRDCARPRVRPFPGVSSRRAALVRCDSERVSRGAWHARCVALLAQAQLTCSGAAALPRAMEELPLARAACLVRRRGGRTVQRAGLVPARPPSRSFDGTTRDTHPDLVPGRALHWARCELHERCRIAEARPPGGHGRFFWRGFGRGRHGRHWRCVRQ